MKRCPPEWWIRYSEKGLKIFAKMSSEGRDQYSNIIKKLIDYSFDYMKSRRGWSESLRPKFQQTGQNYKDRSIWIEILKYDAKTDTIGETVGVHRLIYAPYGKTFNQSSENLNLSKDLSGKIIENSLIYDTPSFIYDSPSKQDGRYINYGNLYNQFIKTYENMVSGEPAKEIKPWMYDSLPILTVEAFFNRLLE